MTAANRPVAIPPPAPEHRGPRVALVVAAEPGPRAILAAKLRAVGHQIFEAGTGRDGLALSRHHAPDIVLCDWTLPDMAGTDFCRNFRALARDSHGYVVLLTAERPAREIEAALRAGVDDFLMQPVSAAKLLARLAAGERILKIEDQLRSSNRQLQAAMDSLKQAQDAMDRDLREARKLQQGLVRERSGRFDRIELSLLLRPAGHIGGDLVGFFQISPSRIGIYAIDVSGHGVAAALLTAQLAAHLSGSADHNIAIRAANSDSEGTSPAALAHFFNRMMLEEMVTDTYFTMVYAELCTATGEVRMVQAGHPHPVIQRVDGRVESVGRGGMPVGVFDAPLFDEITVRLHPGDRMLIASDGITEAMTRTGVMLGTEGLDAILRTNAFLHGHAFLESMAWSVSKYCDGDRLDDMSAVLIEHLPAIGPLDLNSAQTGG